jgi:hypothetical protein
MKCRYCGDSFKLSPLNKDSSTCLECSGVVDDFSVEDEELKIDLQQLKNPSGRTQPVIYDEDDFEQKGRKNAVR